jgi:hypothetical protein
MAIETKIYEWKTDFSAADTNSPANEDTISDKLGEYARDVKAVVRKDLSLFDAVGGRSVGKEYTLYKSEIETEIDGGATYDIRIRDVDNETLIRPNLKIRGNWSSAFYPGTRFAIASSYTDLNRNKTAIVTSVEYPVFISGDTNEYTKIYYSPVLASMDRTEISALNTGTEESDFYIQFDDTVPEEYSPGARVMFIQTEATRSDENPYNGSTAHFPTKVYSAVVKEIDSENDRVILYNKTQQLAVDIDDLSVDEAEGLFPDNDTLAPKGEDWSPSTDTNYILASTNFDIAEDDFLLLGAQSGNWNFASFQHRMTSVLAQIDGELDPGETVIVPTATVPFPYVGETSAGKDVRVKVQCVGVVAGSGVTVPSDALHPTVLMNEWSTTTLAWDTLSGPFNRLTNEIILKFNSGIPAGVTLLFDIAVVLPTFNGKTYYKPD